VKEQIIHTERDVPAMLDDLHAFNRDFSDRYEKLSTEALREIDQL
jgi:hypothetical protein